MIFFLFACGYSDNFVDVDMSQIEVLELGAEPSLSFLYYILELLFSSNSPGYHFPAFSPADGTKL